MCIRDRGWWSLLLKRGDVENRGIGGDNTFGMIDRLPDILKSKPRKIFLMAGINDLTGGQPVDTIVMNITRCLLYTSDPDPEPGVEKPRFIWVDAAANFPDFANSKENILRDLTKAREAGFTDIVVDVRPTTGDVLFRTSVVDQVEWLGAWLPGGYSKVERTAT